MRREPLLVCEQMSVRAGLAAYWCDLPERHGEWKTMNRHSVAGVVPASGEPVVEVTRRRSRQQGSNGQQHHHPGSSLKSGLPPHALEPLDTGYERRTVYFIALLP